MYRDIIERIVTNGTPLVALSSKNLDGLKKLPYTSAHFFRLVYMCLGPTVSAQNTIPPLPSCRQFVDTLRFVISIFKKSINRPRKALTEKYAS